MLRRTVLSGLGASTVAGCSRASPVPPKPVEPIATAESEARKQRSLAILKAEGVDFIEHLPVIQDSTQVRLRDAREVAARFAALMLVSFKGATGNHAKAQQFREAAGRRAILSPIEQAFMDDPASTAEERGPFSWAVEAALPLAWALGKLDRLDRPDHPTDKIPLLGGVVFDDGAQALSSAPHLRSPAEILDQADLIYRYHWALTEHRVRGKARTAGLSQDVVMERHKALNWLIRYGEADWDDVSTDT